MPAAVNAIQIGAGVALAAIAVTGAWLDMRFRRLPNRLCAVGLLAGLSFGLAAGGAGWMGMSALHAGLALLAGMALFALGILGGGDAKYYAALAAWFPLGHAFLLMGTVSLTGLLLLVAWLALRKRAASGGRAQEADGAFRKLPYGVAIGAGAVLAFSLQPLPG